MTPPSLIRRAGAPIDFGAPALVLFTVPSDDGLLPDESGVAVLLGLDLPRLLEAERARGEAGEVVSVPLSGSDGPRRLLLAGTGQGDAAALRTAGAAVARRCASSGEVAIDTRGLDAAGLRAFAEGLALAAYLTPTGAGPADGPAVPKVLATAVLAVADDDDPSLAAAVDAAAAVARAVHLARDLVNTPSLVKTPAWFADQAVAAAVEAGLDVEVLGPEELAAQGFGAILGVGQGSAHPPRFVRLTYVPRQDAGARHVVLVGKGITFDSGGLSLKPAVPMAGMKTDMAGAAAVLATLSALPALDCPVRVTGLLSIAENMIGGGAMRPGDVLTCWGGTTVEVLNTDAEGRLVLADALAYAVGTLAPDAVVDLATLTGAISVALGRRTAGLFATDDPLAGELDAAASAAGEQVWRLPLTEDYLPALESQVADLANIGRALDVSGGSITAALFLRAFTGGVPWAHLDIAGTARSDSDDGVVSRGGTGWGVRTLLAWLTSPL